MKHSEAKLLDILDKTLSNVISGEASVEDCLHAYPEYAQELRPLLETALQLHTKLAPPGPSPSYITNTKIRILNRVGGRSAPKERSETRRPRRRNLILRPAFTFLTLFVILGLLFSSIGIISASADALPGDGLYGVKRGVEELRIGLTLSPSGDMELLSEFAENRVEEIEALLAAGREEDVEVALSDYDEIVTELLTLLEEEDLSNEPETADELQSGMLHHLEVLQQVLENAPESARKGLENALEKSSHGISILEHKKQGGSPSDLAPGQEKKNDESGKPGGGQGQGNDGESPSNSSERTPGPPPKKTPKPKKK
jgi:hypothetical protein